MAKSFAAFVLGIAMFALHAVVPSNAFAFRQKMDVEVMSVTCEDMYTVDYGPVGEVPVGMSCTARVSVTLDGAPYPQTGTTLFRVTQLHSQCGDTFDEPVDMYEEVMGTGVYDLFLECEPDDVTLLVTDAGPGLDAGGVASWGRSDRIDRALAWQTHDAAERTSFTVDEAADQTSTMAATLDDVDARTNAIHGTVGSIWSFLTGTTQNTLNAVKSVVDDIASFLGA